VSGNRWWMRSTCPCASYRSRRRDLSVEVRETFGRLCWRSAFSSVGGGLPRRRIREQRSLFEFQTRIRVHTPSPAIESLRTGETDARARRDPMLGIEHDQK